MITGRVRQIETMGLLDGPGIRVVIFMQGCSLRCLFCHNPEMWNKEGGKEYIPEEILDIILRYKNYFDNSGGVTFSGGEPLFQPVFLLECLKLCKENNIHTCIDTSGAGDSSYFEEVLKYTDLVIYSIKGIDTEEYMKMTRSPQDLKFLEACQQYNIKLWIRHVIIPEINDNEDHIKKLGIFIKKIKNVEKIELLPYHTMGVSKYKDLNIDYPLKDIPSMDKDKCQQLEEKLLQIIKKQV